MRTIPKITVILGLIFLIPLNIYHIGEGYGNGIQWAFFKFQVTPFGSMWFGLTNDVYYATSGIITGRSAFSLLLWALSSLTLLIVVFAFLFLPRKKKNFEIYAIIIIIAGLLYLMSCMLQYGLTLSGPAGFSIPLGIPVIWVLGFIIYSDLLKGADENKIEEKEK